MSDGAWERVPIDAQSVDAPLSRSAIFLVMSAGESEQDLAGVRDALGAIGDLVKNVGFRDLNGRLSCIVGIGRALWDRLSPGHRPLDLHPFAPIHGPVHTAPSTPGDLLFHIRAEREDMTFEFERQLLDVLGDAARSSTRRRASATSTPAICSVSSTALPTRPAPSCLTPRSSARTPTRTSRAAATSSSRSTCTT